MFQITSKVFTPLKINKLKLSVVSLFSNMLCGKKRKPENVKRNRNQKTFLNKKDPLLNIKIFLLVCSVFII